MAKEKKNTAIVPPRTREITLMMNGFLYRLKRRLEM
jgi:hypothetical protein